MTPGPYVIKHGDTRRTAETIEEVWRVVDAIVHNGRTFELGSETHRAIYMQTYSLPDAGGTVGPLPDGSTVVVELA